MRPLRGLTLLAFSPWRVQSFAAPGAGGPAGRRSRHAAGTAEGPAPMPRGPTAYVNAVAVLRREATDAARIPGKPGAKEVANYLATLYRGEKVAVLETARGLGPRPLLRRHARAG